MRCVLFCSDRWLVSLEEGGYACMKDLEGGWKGDIKGLCSLFGNHDRLYNNTFGLRFTFCFLGEPVDVFDSASLRHGITSDQLSNYKTNDTPY